MVRIDKVRHPKTKQLIISCMVINNPFLGKGGDLAPNRIELFVVVKKERKGGWVGNG